MLGSMDALIDLNKGCGGKWNLRRGGEWQECGRAQCSVHNATDAVIVHQQGPQEVKKKGSGCRLHQGEFEIDLL